MPSTARRIPRTASCGACRISAWKSRRFAIRCWLSSGQLNREDVRPEHVPQIPPAALEGSSDPDKIWKASSEDEASRRTVYVFLKRSMIVPMLEVLDLCDTSAQRRQAPEHQRRHAGADAVQRRFRQPAGAVFRRAAAARQPATIRAGRSIWPSAWRWRGRRKPSEIDDHARFPASGESLEADVPGDFQSERVCLCRLTVPTRRDFLLHAGKSAAALPVWR